MRRYTAAVLAAFLLPWPALGQAICVPRAALLAELESLHNEVPTARGLGPHSQVLEVLTSPEGTFTILITRPDGITCAVASGRAWQNVAQPNQAPGEGS